MSNALHAFFGSHPLHGETQTHISRHSHIPKPCVLYGTHTQTATVTDALNRPRPATSTRKMMRLCTLAAFVSGASALHLAGPMDDRLSACAAEVRRAVSHASWGGGTEPTRSQLVLPHAMPRAPEPP